MSAFVLIESRCSTEAPEVRGFLEVAAQLSGEGHEIALILIQNGVLLAAAGADPSLEALANRPNVSVWADDFSLQTRALQGDELAPGIRIASMQELMQLITAGNRNPIWH
jgi:sulfur relay (sulfurtransferase) complex TusBCD TusD component (DsrE family)